MGRRTKKQSRLPATLSFITINVSTTIALISIPFVFVAGLGLLTAVPFGALALTERQVRLAILDGDKLSIRTRRKRLGLIGCSFLGSTSIIILIQLANRTNSELSTDRKIYALIPWVVALVTFTVMSTSIQLLYKKK